MSLTTTIAQANANAAEARWSEHLKVCHQCHEAKRDKRPAWRCPDGQQAATDARELRTAARREAELDARPAFGQGSLFGQGDLFDGQADA